MYNGTIIDQLLSERKLRKKDIQDALGISFNSYKTIVYGNPTVKTLEPVADFFNVSMDVFFNREFSCSNKIGNVSGNSNTIQQGEVNVMQSSLEKEIENLKLLLVEKDKVISEKERLIGVLMKNK
ncbi:helix-turn-helix transcriptional regulator [Parabacteroides sp. HGS0025]|jgi:transcriptional regulator with XRE-family HTH domain|uniref:helix-turn-helix domain-containing protein n=1 Tax=Parabacteroides sp. HGS0025 TaxID=1078087 RepID=UPI0006174EBF|nr:helix-turn-helix transcriptional regulator [Parabacteroides sp. HGS0025]KKB45934.1 hypothetical protein HMPREF1212_04909 [Parabacteroides sp. HGS0025]